MMLFYFSFNIYPRTIYWRYIPRGRALPEILIILENSIVNLFALFALWQIGEGSSLFLHLR
jgi:hypothetical protein